MHGGAEVVGRETELGLLRRFFEPEHDGRALVLSGGPGIGKTTLWEAGIRSAREGRARVLVARPNENERRLSFAALADLLEDVDADVMGRLPPPQRQALEVALLRVGPDDRPPEARPLATGFLHVLVALGQQQPVVLAIDDVQWLDRASADTIAFAARRLERHPARFLLAKRTGSTSVVTEALEPPLTQSMAVTGLSLGAIRRLLADRLDLVLRRHGLRWMVECTEGNPLFALELARALIERGESDIGAETPVPESVEDLLGLRVRRLPRLARHALLAVALSPNISEPRLSAVVGREVLDDAVDAGLLLIDRDRVRPSHPLLAAAARARARASEQRAIHLELAAVATQQESKALHLALATESVDDQVAEIVASAAAVASRRGAREDAVVLGEHSLRLTPIESALRVDRLLDLAEYLMTAGEDQRASELLGPELHTLPRGAARVRAHLLLADAEASHVDPYDAHLTAALAESGSDTVLRAAVLARLATHRAIARVEQVAEAERWAREAVAGAPSGDASLERDALHALGWIQSLRGRSLDNVIDRYRGVSEDAVYGYRSIDRVSGVRLAWRGQIGEALELFERLVRLADERGEALSFAGFRVHLCEVELRAGRWDDAERLLDEWNESPEGELVVAPAYERCRAVLAAGRGLPDETERWVAAALARVEATGVRWDLLETQRVRGIAALTHNPQDAARHLREVWEHTEREGVDDPGAFPVAPDLVEALAELGQLEEASAVCARLSDLARDQAHPWALATARRCRGVIAFASGADVVTGRAQLAEAAAEYDALGLRFDRARTLLALGRAERRRRGWAAARVALEHAATAFDEMGSPGWAEQTRDELHRIGGRRPHAANELTPTERRIVELAAQGLSNKEIAAQLVVSVHTVEVHLSHAYAKLGVRSRSQLRARL